MDLEPYRGTTVDLVVAQVPGLQLLVQELLVKEILVEQTGLVGKLIALALVVAVVQDPRVKTLLPIVVLAMAVLVERP